MARPGLTSHRKFRRLSRVLGSRMTARGALELLWDSCYESGEEYVGTADDIEGLVGWDGEAGMLTKALADAGAPEGKGFIDVIRTDHNGEIVYKVHDLWHHAPRYVAQRRQREIERQQRVAPPAERRRMGRAGAERHRFGIDEIKVPPPPSPSPSPSPSHSPSHNEDQDQDLPPQKSRRDS